MARQFSEVLNLLKNSNALFGSIAKSRTAKIVRTILDTVAEVPDSVDIQVDLCRDIIEWCKTEKRTFLRQRVESKVSLFQFLLCVLSLLCVDWMRHTYVCSLPCCCGRGESPLRRLLS